jgi:hypothetical protein
LFLLIVGVLAVFMVWSARRQLKEHPPPVQQPTEAG